MSNQYASFMLYAAVAASTLLALALPNDFVPFGMAPLGTVALVPVLYLVYRCNSSKEAARMGALFGALSTALGNYWLAFFGEFSVWTLGGAVLGYTGYNYMLFAFLHHAVRNIRDLRRPVIIATVWAGYEYLKSVGFLGYPWGLIAYPLAAGPALAQFAELTGVWGLSWLGAFTNAAVAHLLDHRVPAPTAVQLDTPWYTQSSAGSIVLRSPDCSCCGRTTALNALKAAAALTAAVALFGTIRLTQPVPTVARVPMVLVQQNVDSWRPGAFVEALAQAIDLSRRGLTEAPGSLLVWSETALRRPYIEEDDYYATRPPDYPLRSFLADQNAILLAGAPMFVSEHRDDMTNSAVLIGPDGKLRGNYGKQQLVPFAEQIPGWNLPAVQRFFRNVIGLYGTWVPGNGPQSFEVPEFGIRVAAPICFEDAFGDVVRRLVETDADVLINLTNNSWSRRNSAQIQHLVAARLRTIENRRVLVRGTNSGLTGVIDAHGRIVAQLPMFVPDVLVQEVAVQRQPYRTLYQVIGDLWGWVFVAASVVATVRATTRLKNGR